MIKELLDLNENKKLKSWQGYRLDIKNVMFYIKDAYNTSTVTSVAAKTISNIQPLLQVNYNGEGDCTLISITTILCYYLEYTKSVQEIYDIIEEYAEKIFYNDNCDTIPNFIQSIINRAAAKVGLKANSFSKNFKENGVTWDRIKKLIQGNRPVILSLSNDGREYYANHSITIVGYNEYKIDGDNIVRMLRVYDSWRETISFVDFKKIGRVCCINYF